MNTISVDDIMARFPCDEYTRDRVESLLAPYGGNINISQAMGLPISAWDKAWVCICCGLLTDLQLRTVACDTAEAELTRERAEGREPDARSWAAVEAGRRHAIGDIDDAALNKAKEAAREASAETMKAGMKTEWVATTKAAWEAAKAAAASASLSAKEAARWMMWSKDIVKTITHVAGIDRAM